MSDQLDLVAGDPGEVEQVVQQPGLIPHLALDDLTSFLHEASIAGGMGDHLHRGQDRRQRRPQLVGEHGEEVVLSSVLSLDLPTHALLALVESGVLDSEADLVGDDPEQRFVILGRTGLGRIERRKKPEGSPGKGERVFPLRRRR